MIYRIHHDENYLMHLVHPVESMRKLGEQHGNLAHFGFVEAKLQDVAIFKTRLDTWTGICCSDKLKRAYENAGLTGIAFHPDVSNPIGDPHGTLQ